MFGLSTTVFFVAIFTTFPVYFFLKCLRMELFRPKDEPIIFDREHRKIYRIFRAIQPEWKAEHHATTNADGSTISRIHTLIFLVRRSLTDPTIVDGSTFGSSMLHGEVTVPAVYEHVRKFMEEGGPHLSLGDTLSVSKRPVTFLECMGRTGPDGETLKQWWQNVRSLPLIGPIFFRSHFL